MNGKICKRCLLSETDEAGVYRTIRRRIEQMSPEQRTGAEEYQRRLGICQACDALTNGLCGMCGCFIELRAAQQSRHCPCGQW